MMPLAGLKPIWFVTLIVVGSAEDSRQYQVAEKARAVHFGMSPDQVLEILGRPDDSFKARDFWQFVFLGFDSEQWYWGSTVDLRAIVIPSWPGLNPMPFNLRLFSYDDYDLVICWGFDDRVTEVRRPELKPPHIAHDLLECWLFVADVRQIVFEQADR